MKSRTVVSRREFILSTAAAGTAASFMIVKPESVRGTAANDAVSIGWIGAGGRGTADARGLTAAGGRIVAIGDVFQDRIDAARQKLQVEEGNCHIGFDAYKKVCDMKVDAVLLVTPPGFRPAEFKAAVDAGKHVFMEKPIAVDTWGCRQVLGDGEKAKGKKLSVVVGLQRRYSFAYQEAQKRIAAGALGTIVAGRGFYLTGDVWKGRHWQRSEFQDDLHWMTRNWYYFRWLSGDLITEQNIHNLDACNWVLGGHPLKCVGYGGRKWRKYIGDIYDHFNVTYEYPGGVHLTFMSGQFCTFHDSSEQILGTDSTFANSGRTMKIEGKNAWEWSGQDDSNRNEYEAFIKSVREGQPRYDVPHAVDGTFTTILGREAAYRRKEIEWTKLWRENQKLDRKPYRVT
ncbi:MAG: Gfo/Idh/MocA family oxidoreductase [Acidobacteria bacterium]|nr:Gfo/Idh/MocA family oxidoreductase [Acidobacteriota bacterium]